MRNEHRPSRSTWRSGRVQLAVAAGAVVAAAVAAAAVDAAAPTGHQAAAAKTTTVKVRKTAVGRILVDARGRTLYMFARDRKGKSACYGSCATFWPPVRAVGKLRATGGASAKLLGKTRRKDGRMQLTYRRHPLYTFKLDRRAGQLNGQALLEDGGKWYVLSAAGAVIKRKPKAAAAPAPPPPAATTTTTSGGGDDGGGGAAWG